MRTIITALVFFATAIPAFALERLTHSEALALMPAGYSVDGKTCPIVDRGGFFNNAAPELSNVVYRQDNTELELANAEAVNEGAIPVFKSVGGPSAGWVADAVEVGGILFALNPGATACVAYK